MWTWMVITLTGRHIESRKSGARVEKMQTDEICRKSVIPLGRVKSVTLDERKLDVSRSSIKYPIITHVLL